MKPVLTDILGNEFTEGDRVVISTSTGLRIGPVDWIREDSKGYYTVYILLQEHHDLEYAKGKMHANRMGYGFTESYFLKLPDLTDTSD